MPDKQDSQSQTPLLSKNQFLKGRRCPNLLWYSIHQPDQIAQPSIISKAKVRQGRMVAHVAQDLFPNGYRFQRTLQAEDVSNSNRAGKFYNLHDPDLPKDIRDKLNPSNGIPLLEVPITDGKSCMFADILVPVESSNQPKSSQSDSSPSESSQEQRWDLVEIKSAIGLKREHYADVAYQSVILKNAGFSIRNYYIYYINNNYVRGKKVNLKRLFKREKVNLKIQKLTPRIEEDIASYQRILTLTEPPRQSAGKPEQDENRSREINLPEKVLNRHCQKPVYCPLQPVCWPDLKHADILNLHRGRQLAMELMEKGFHSLSELTDTSMLSEHQRIQYQCEKNQEEHLNVEEIRKFLKQLRYPLYYLDLEAFQSIVPLYENTKAFDQIPFQFSLHIQQTEGGPVEHTSFLHRSDQDPRAPFLHALVENIGPDGTILAYNAEFEMQRFDFVSKQVPEHRKWAQQAITRFIDLYQPFRNFHYYHYNQNGSVSMKNVLLAMTGKSYGDMTIKDGLTASQEYSRITFGEVSEEEKDRVRQQLLDYCNLDTEAMVEIIRTLQEKVGA